MRENKTGYAILIILSTVAVICAWLYMRSTALNPPIYDTTRPVAKVKIDTSNIIAVPSWKLFHEGQMWSIVNPARLLDTDFTPNLATIEAPHAPNATKVAKQILTPLNSMMTKASNDGVELMLSSAYRSATDQRDIYESLLASHGAEYANKYVALPGASEHQTGLAIDIASFTPACSIDANACSLDANGIAWLRANASSYGFIERYPPRKRSITGVADEHWHYRYTGVALAKILINADMTLDEFVDQVAPGYAK